jgi:3-O-alpha-D-mannopyranosyl-alpha-D-mannopyranose xylosylphosphotransferase
MFSTELAESATRGFRESKRGLADLEMAWLVGHLRVERWREALLWSWAVGRVGGSEGVWGVEARKELMDVLKMISEDEEVVIIQRSERETLNDLARLEENTGWEAAKSTRFIFCKWSRCVMLWYIEY